MYDILYKSISPTFMYHLVLHKFFQCAPSFCPPQNMPFAKHAPPTRTAPTRSRGVKPRPVAQGRQQPLSRRRPTVVRIQFLAGLLRLPSHHSTTIDARRAAELARPRMQTPNLHFLQEQKRCPTNASASHCVTKSSLKGIGSPLEACFGPEIHAKNHWGGKEGYRLHSCMVSFSWCSKPVETKIATLPSSELRAQANNALEWLRQNSGKSKEESAYWSFYQEQSNFFRKNPAPEERQLKRHLRFIETEGLECAMWPHVFHQRQQCLTWTRNQSATRIARAAPCRHTKNQRLPASNLIGAEEESEVADEEQQENHEKTVGVRRAYQALMLSPWLDASMSYELTHFAYDLVIWTDVGSKRNLRTNIPMRLMLKGHSFSPEYWRDMHRALINLTKQKGYPQVFSTVVAVPLLHSRRHAKSTPRQDMTKTILRPTNNFVKK